MIVHTVTPADSAEVARHRYPDEAGEREPYAAWVAGAMERGLYLGFVTLEGQKVIAGAGLTLLEWGPSRSDPQPWRGRVVNVWTHPDWRRRGMAHDLVTRCLEAARQRGITRISLGTSAQARGLYERLGFQASGTEMGLALPPNPS